MTRSTRFLTAKSTNRDGLHDFLVQYRRVNIAVSTVYIIIEIICRSIFYSPVPGTASTGTKSICGPKRTYIQSIRMITLKEDPQLPVLRSSTCCSGPGKASHQYPPPGVRISHQGLHNRKWQCGKHSGCPRWLSSVSPKISNTTNANDIPISCSFLHLNLTCRS